VRCWLQTGGQSRQGTRQGQAATRPDPPSFGRYHACKEADAEEKAPAEGQLATGLSVVDAIDSYAKSDQHGHRIRRLWRGSARASRREAFLGVEEPDSPLTA
jgi:hypothetical protein